MTNNIGKLIKDSKLDPFEKTPNRIGELINSSDKSLKQISHETGISYSTLGNYNQGTRTPKKENAKILADYFGVSIPYLLGLDDNPVLKDPDAPKEILNKKEELNQLMETIVKTKALDGYLQFLCYKDYSSESVSRLTQLIYDCLDKERSNFNYENA